MNTGLSGKRIEKPMNPQKIILECWIFAAQDLTQTWFITILAIFAIGNFNITRIYRNSSQWNEIRDLMTR